MKHPGLGEGRAPPSTGPGQRRLLPIRSGPEAMMATPRVPGLGNKAGVDEEHRKAGGRAGANVPRPHPATRSSSQAAPRSVTVSRGRELSDIAREQAMRRIMPRMAPESAAWAEPPASGAERPAARLAEPSAPTVRLSRPSAAGRFPRGGSHSLPARRRCARPEVAGGSSRRRRARGGPGAARSARGRSRGRARRA